MQEKTSDERLGESADRLARLEQLNQPVPTGKKLREWTAFGLSAVASVLAVFAFVGGIGRGKKTLIPVTIVCLLVAGATLADLKFTRLSEDQFVISHRKQSVFGGQAKAMKTLHKEVAAMCIAAGFTHFEVTSQKGGQRQLKGGGFGRFGRSLSGGIGGSVAGRGRGASATIQAKFHKEDGEDLIDCAGLADPKKVEKAKKKLAIESRR